MDSLPLITAELPGIGGVIKAEPEHFVVEEIPLYEPEGEGEHVYVRLRREGWTTRSVQEELAGLFGLDTRSVGCAGLKDKCAIATQTFSLHLFGASEDEVASRIQEVLPFQVIGVRRHRNKLRTGHLLGNRFVIQVLSPEPGAAERVPGIVETLRERGLPNFYGSQRFGRGGSNIEEGRRLLLGEIRRKPWLSRFLLSAYQSYLFNLWLAARIRAGWFGQVLPGDIARKEDTGGIFEVEDAPAEQLRFQSREISYTGPIYGKKLRCATGEPGQLEARILDEAGVTTEMLRRARLDGTRRLACIFLSDLCVEPQPEGLTFSFSLPKGGYATILLREFMKAEPQLGEE